MRSVVLTFSISLHIYVVRANVIAADGNCSRLENGNSRQSLSVTGWICKASPYTVTFHMQGLSIEYYGTLCLELAWYDIKQTRPFLLIILARQTKDWASV